MSELDLLIGPIRIGQRVVTLLGDVDDDDGTERHAPPGTRGAVVLIETDSAGGPLYHVIFETGVWIVLSPDEINDPAQYTLLEMGG